MNKNKIIRGFLPLVALLLLINSCNIFDPSADNKTLNIIGTWESTSSWGTSKIEITGTTYENYWNNTLSYQGEIKNLKNNELNAGSSTTGLTDYGFFTVLYSGGSGDGKYGIVRWKSLKTTTGVTTMSYCEGSNYPTSTYYDSASEAEAGMDDSYFAFYSEITKK